MEKLTVGAKDLRTRCLEPLFQKFDSLCVVNEESNSRVYELVIYLIGDVKCMQEESCELELFLSHFEAIRVEGFDSFFTLIPPSASLQNLTRLEVFNCNSLEDLGASSIIKILVNLTVLDIKWCEKIVEIIRKDDEDLSGNKIVFSKLKSLVLYQLPCLERFCSSSSSLEFPALEDLDLRYCANMKMFCEGDVATPKLSYVEGLHWRYWDSDDFHPNHIISVNEVIRYNYEKSREVCTGIH